MNGVNKAIIVGTLGKNPELKYTLSGQAVTNFSVATNETYKDKQGTKQTKTTWHNIVIWGKLGEIANQYLTKGSSVYLEGKIENRSYDDKDGNKKYISEIVVNNMVMLGSKGNNHAERTDPDTGLTDSDMAGIAADMPNGDSNDLPF